MPKVKKNKTTPVVAKTDNVDNTTNPDGVVVPPEEAIEKTDNVDNTTKPDDVVVPPADNDGEEGNGDDNEPTTVLVVDADKDINQNCITVLTYAETMGPNVPNGKDTILRSQMKLYQAITAIVSNLKGEEFVNVYGQVLKIMDEYSDTFADKLLFRGFNELRISATARTRFENLLILMVSTASPENRASALKVISFDAFAKDFDSVIEQKIRGFYRQ